MPLFMIVLIPYINLFNLSWIINCRIFEEYGAINDSSESVYSNGLEPNQTVFLFCLAVVVMVKRL